MLMRNESPILVAEPLEADAERLERLLRQMGYAVRVTVTAEQTLGALREEVFVRAIVAIELTLDGEPLLGRLRRLPAMNLLVATGPPAEGLAEVRARQAGADVYLPRPVQFVPLAMVLGVSVSPHRLPKPP